ncbi:homoserine kinase [Paenibacillus apiarius]|uniref:Homoserine kinase n=1 Tax=Paenibacillus apiarius TaxID=46240 RepID=A0ABT4DYW5_9BACL|nr:homoserine kinase [Paenibacillus apiarius]MCY9516559.1 homoserine kinase [Paenibacillus apiarius]MCY9522550.1 homoserine kinase [Paenibacillus apiarius]MCY9554526.1 homoserine kinase [Paenibacillus apiarius]MCY9556642.1 homoserine kinase [Paenibacillus apiarius]MCY9686677.1 homoserine kinase [Paenibacillus apiarius]
MWQQDGVLVRVPASTANLGPGFDTLGMALHLHLWIAMKPAETTVIRLHGSELAGIPTDESNLIYRVAHSVFRAAGVEGRPLEMDVYSEIPLTRGLGSSASAIIGGLYAANALIGHPLSQEQLFNMATLIERHPDNVGASLFGGIIAAAWDGEQTEHIRIEPHGDLSTVVAIPQFQLETKMARNVLPAHVSLADAVFNISRSSLLVAALSSGQLHVIATAMRDRLHQPYRASLIPGMPRILDEAPGHGALGVALSGAGPTLLAFTDKRRSNASLVSYMKETFLAHGVEATVMEVEISREGAVCCGTWDGISSVLAARINL